MGYHDCVKFTDADEVEKVMVIGLSDDPEVFDGKIWTSLNDDSFPYLHFARASAYKSELVVTGRESSLILINAWRYDVESKTWEESFEMDPPVEYHTSFLVPRSF